MNINFTLIKTRPDCEALINIINQEKEDLEYQKTALERKIEAGIGTSVEVDADLLSANTEIAALEAVIAGLPDGKTKNNMISRKKKLEYRVFFLTERKSNYGVVALFEKEFDIGCIDKQIEEADAFVAAVTEHMNSL